MERVGAFTVSVHTFSVEHLHGVASSCRSTVCVYSMCMILSLSFHSELSGKSIM